MNRERKPTESFKQYRDNLKTESLAVKKHLQGTYFWISKQPKQLGSTFRYKDHE
jgi:hypothetical protein